MRVIIILAVLIGYIQLAKANTFDPMKPPWLKHIKRNYEVDTNEPRKTEFILRQIVTHKQGNRAVINGYILKQGEHIFGAKVVKVNKDSVLLVRGKKKWTLKIENVVTRVRR